MRSGKEKCIFTILLLFVALSDWRIAGGDVTDWEEVSLEELLNEEVITAGKRPQKLKEAPATISVISQEDIRDSGAIDIPDLLRMVAGIDVITITPSDQNINARGFNGEMSDQMLVMIDGRSIYWDFYGLVPWDTLPIDIREIKRVEVIRGPGSALYGANALSGVVNIITQQPEEINSTIVSATAGNVGTIKGTLIHSKKIRGFNYKVSFTQEERDRWKESRGKALENKRANVTVSCSPVSDSRLSLSGGINDGRGLTMTGIGMMERQNRLGYFQFDYGYRDLVVRAFVNSGDVTVVQQSSGDENSFSNHTYDFESQYNLHPMKTNDLVIGGNYRRYHVDSDMLDAPHIQSLQAVYFSDEHWIRDDLAVTLGLRYDRHPLVDPQVSLRGNVMYSLRENHAFRFSFGTAFNNPSFINSYVYKDIDVTGMVREELSEEFLGTPMEPFIPTLPSLVPDGTIWVDLRGNLDLKPGKITTYEVEYQGLISTRIQGTAVLFLNDLSDFIWFSQVSTRNQDLSADFGLPAGMVVASDIPSYSFVNVGEARALGGEVGLNLLIKPYLSGDVNYSYQYITNRTDDPTTPENEEGRRFLQYPVHKLNVALRMKSQSGLSMRLGAHYVSGTEWREDYAYGKIDGYILLNGRAVYSLFRENLEVGLSLYNILDVHFEYPATDITGTQIVADEVGRRVLGDVSFRF